MPKFRVKELAKARGLTTEELAIKSGVKMSTVRNLWQGRTADPAYSTLRAIAAALEVRVEDLEQPEDGAEKNVTPGLVAA
ncbi:MAG TPA: helix-turn-helix transcriptional regulator [Roseiflexaceae bacterium]|nr:helix-turn-helix transcriptional regulator [Roseiflexaceae bacterium]